MTDGAMTVAQAGRKGGLANTPAQAAARARNGRNGGRPRNAPVHGRVVKYSHRQLKKIARGAA